MQEIEVKFRLDALPPPLRICRWLAHWGARVGRPQLLRYRDLYWDTPAWDLARHRLALRLRLSHKATWTLKGREEVTPEMVRRMEVEAPVPYDRALAFLRDPRPDRLPTPLREHLPPLDRLEVIVDLTGERQVFAVCREGEQATLHVEEVWLGTRREIFLELEGPSSLVQSFSRTWTRFTGQAPEVRSKLVWALLHTQAQGA